MTLVLRDEVGRDLTGLTSLYSARFAGKDEKPKTGSLAATFDFATLMIEHELQLLGLMQESARVPLDDQLQAPRYAAIHAAWRRAHTSFAESRPDYKPAVLEAVGAVEQLARLVVGKPTATLGDAIRELRKSEIVPSPLLKGIEELWGWSSGEPGLRHGASVDSPVTLDEARYMLTLADASLFLLLSRDGGTA